MRAYNILQDLLLLWPHLLLLWPPLCCCSNISGNKPHKELCAKPLFLESSPSPSLSSSLVSIVIHFVSYTLIIHLVLYLHGVPGWLRRLSIWLRPNRYFSVCLAEIFSGHLSVSAFMKCLFVFSKKVTLWEQELKVWPQTHTWKSFYYPLADYHVGDIRKGWR